MKSLLACRYLSSCTFEIYDVPLPPVSARAETADIYAHACDGPSVLANQYRSRLVEGHGVAYTK